MATTPYPFVASTVLTASQLNSTFNIPVSTKTANYVLTAADAGTRVVMNAAGATTITVNTSLFSAGDNLQISNIGAGVTTLTAGTATVSSAGPLAIPQFGGGTLYFTSAGVSIFFPSAGPAASSGLTFITGGSLSGTATSIDNCFSATYLNYKIVLNDLIVSAGSRVAFRMRVSGADNTTSNYTFGVYGIDTAGSTFTAVLAAANGTSFRLTTGTDIGSGMSTGFDIQGPFAAKPTSWGMANVMQGETATVATANGVFKASTSFDGITFFPFTSPETLTGTYKIYGYANS